MSTFSISCLIVLWIFMSWTSTNGSVAKQIGLYKSPYQRIYMVQSYTFFGVVKFISAVSNVMADVHEQTKVPLSFKLQFMFLKQNVFKVCTDFAIGANYYLGVGFNDSNPSDLNTKIRLDFTSSNHILSLLNLLMQYDAVLRHVTAQVESSPDRNIIVRYAILRRVALTLKMNPIEWSLSDPIIKRMCPGRNPFILTRFNLALANMLLIELRSMSKKSRYDGLALALKTVFYTHPEYHKSLLTTDILRIGVLKNQKFVDSDVFTVFSFDRHLINFKTQDKESSFKTTIKAATERAALLVFDCDRYLIIPRFGKGTVIYTSLGTPMTEYLDALVDSEIDVSLWMLDYFSKTKKSYFLFDTYDPSLSFQDRFFDLKKDTWDESMTSLHLNFIETMDYLFNDNVYITSEQLIAL